MIDQEYRFPQPEFTGGYEYPELNPLNPETWPVPWFDLIYLILALAAAWYFLYRRRSRTGLFVLSILSMVYLGFIREGCVCPVGATQPVIQSLFDGSLVLPLTTLAAFLIPFIAALFLGRIFCGAVCPLGAVQEVLARFNLVIPKSVSSVLRVIPPAYLILAAVSAASQSDYLICRFDPFVRLFRLNLNGVQLPLALFFLIASVLTYRPYCRFICPYGWLLGAASRLSLFKVRAVEDHCINCGLCDGACPADAVTGPEEEQHHPDHNRVKLRILLVALPFALLLGAWAGNRVSPLLYDLNRDSYTLRALEVPGEENSLEREAFWGGDISYGELEAAAALARDRWTRGLTMGGAVLVLIIFIRLIAGLRRRELNRYEAVPSDCLSCGRCYQACPKEKVRINGVPEKEIST